MKKSLSNLIKNVSIASLIIIFNANYAYAQKHNNDWKNNNNEIYEKNEFQKKEYSKNYNYDYSKPNQTKHKFEEPKNKQSNYYKDDKYSYDNNEYKKNKHDDDKYNNYKHDDWNKSQNKYVNKNHYYKHNNGQNNYYYQHHNVNNYWGPNGKWTSWNSNWGNPYNYARRWGFDDYHPYKGWRKGNYWYKNPSHWSDWGGWYSVFIASTGTYNYNYNLNTYDPNYNNFGSDCMRVETNQWEYGKQAVYSFLACRNSRNQYEEVRGTREFEGWAN